MRDDQRTRDELLKELAQLRRIVPVLEHRLREHDAERVLLAEEVEARRESEGVFRRLSGFREALIENANVLVTVVDPERRVVLWNRAAERISGYPRDRVLGHTCALELLFPEPETCARMQGLLDRVLEGESFEDETLVMRPRGGPNRSLLLFACPLTDRDGTVTGVMAVGVDVTERLEAEAALREVQATFAAFMDEVPGGAFIKNAEGRLIFVNRLLRETFGASGWLDRRGDEFLDPEHAVVDRERDEAALASGAIHYEDVVPDTRGEPRILRGCRFPIPRDGQAPLVGGLLVDISERVRAEEALRESNERFRSFFEDNHCVMLLVDPESGRLIEANGAARGFYGDAALRGGTLAALGPAGDGAGDALAVLRDAAASGDQCELRQRSADGSTRDVVLHAGSIRIEGRPLLYAIVYDITERRRAERRLRFTQYMVDHSADAVFWVAPDGTIRDVNRSACAWFGYPRDQLLSMPLYALDIHLDADGWRAFWKELERRGVLHQETEYALRGGRRTPVDVTSNYTEFEGQVFNCAFVRDVTRRKQAEAERERLQVRVRQAEKAESLAVLAGGIAHDLNNLMMGVVGNVDLARLKLPGGGAVADNLAEIERSAHRASDLARQMLAYAGQGVIELRLLDLNALMLELRGVIESSVPGNASAHFELSPDLPQVRGDREQLRQAVMNLVANSIEALGPEGGVLRIRTEAQHCEQTYLDGVFEEDEQLRGDYVTLEFSDTGCGMDGEVRQRLFEPFFTTKFTGRGLGMSAVQGIVKAHHGAINVYSEPGSGSCIKLWFPVAQTAPVPAGELSAPPVTEALPRTAGLVLLVDDEPAVREVGVQLLGRAGFDIVPAATGMEALALFARRPGKFDCVVLDLTMPQMSGEETLARLRELRPGVPVVIASGFNPYDVAQRLGGAAVEAILQKPYEARELIEAIQSAMQAAGTP